MIVSNSTDTFFRTGAIDQRGRTSTDAILRGQSARCGSDVTAATIDALVAAVIDILGKVVRSQAN